MKKSILFLTLLVTGVLTGCLSNDDDQDRVKTVDMTIYPEIGYGRSIMSDVIVEQMIFSESDDPRKRALSDIITEGFDFTYEIGTEYTFKAKKTWMSNPPQDVSNIKYEFVGPLTTKEGLIEDSEEELTLWVKPDLVKFIPRFSEPGISDDQEPYDALRCTVGENERTLIIKEIEGFDFEEGFNYELRVKRSITANPYAQDFKLLEVIHKEEA